MHGAQTRASGDPYFAHPIEVAGILTDYRMDTATIVTALLHDVIEDTAVTRAEIDGLFGAEIAELVEGVTKLSRLELSEEHLRQAENLRKFILAMSRDVRVLMVKLADRLHNMRTLHFIKSAAKRERIARETLDIYAPLARSIGCHRICTEMEELAFGHLNPVARAALQRRLDALRAEQGAAVSLASEEIAARLQKMGIPSRVFGREKTAFSIWRKLQRKSIGFSQLSDIYAFRVIVDTEDDCYRALGVIHRAWPGLPDRFKDYISTPKRNNYRSIHTTVVGPRGMRIEMQIRTQAMDRVAEQGVAAHWRYKNHTYAFDPEAAEAAGGRDPLANLRQLVQLLEHGGDPEELMEHAKLEMFLDQVFVFTPKGKPDQPADRGDAAGLRLFRPHRRRRQLRGREGQRRAAAPAHAVAERRRGRGDPRRQALGAGRLEVPGHHRPGPFGHPPPHPALRKGRVPAPRQGLSRPDLRAGRQGPRAAVPLRPALERFAAAGENELYDAVGRGRITPAQVLEAVFPGLKDTEKAAASERHRIEDGKAAKIYVRGAGMTAAMSLRFSRCCCPVPGDRIVGIVEPDNVLAVHVIDCSELADVEDQDERWRDLHWTQEAERNTLSLTRLNATITDAPGVLGQACTIIGEAGGNITAVDMRLRHSDFFDVAFDIEVRDVRHLTHIAAALRACPSVETVDRKAG